MALRTFGTIAADPSFFLSRVSLIVMITVESNCTAVFGPPALDQYAMAETGFFVAASLFGQASGGSAFLALGTVGVLVVDLDAIGRVYAL
ncbi:hypothetical protein BD324DRAFT_634550, partial [Kockovaella imperatae]